MSVKIELNALLEIINKNPGIHYNDLVRMSNIPADEVYMRLYGINSWQDQEDKNGEKINLPTIKIVEVDFRKVLLRGLERSIFFFERYLSNDEIKEIKNVWGFE